MLSLLWLVPILPLAGFLILALGGARLSRKVTSAVGVGSVGFSTAAATLVSISFVWFTPKEGSYSQTLWEWMRVGDFAPSVTFYLDALSLTMMVVVTVVGLLIHIYSTAFMASDEGYSRFFAYMNLFVASMLILVLADNLLLLYLGWEGVGLCSYLLIGFWYRERENAQAAMKAFLVTRIGDTVFAIGIFLLFVSVGTLQIQPILDAVSGYPVGAPLCTTAALLLLGGAVGKSAQLPLQTWLPDAMVGPTPVSALIHAATMVTAGVYLIARTHVLFAMSPMAMFIVAIIGTATLLLAAFSALAQDDIKRILAYSTISQIGYMFLALGVGAWAAAIYHFVTHAFFKSALFLGAGIVIKALHEEHDIFRMGGLRRSLPTTFKAFMAAALTLVAVPPLTLTFNSKDFILNEVWLSGDAGRVLWVLATIGTFLTAGYTFRLVFVVFFGSGPKSLEEQPSQWMVVPFAILAVLGLAAGFPELLNAAFGAQGFYGFLQSAMPGPIREFDSHSGVWLFQAIYIATSVAGIALTYLLYSLAPQYVRSIASTFVGSRLRLWWLAGWGFDWLYRKLIITPYVRLARLNRDDFVDAVYVGLERASQGANHLLSLTVNGNVRWYVAGLAAGAVIVMGLVVVL
ncbi:MAG: NADH-quinone oxidoreductase subunit L [Planctomycetes bacterium RBG_13_62_9]|nr:MAG: NADH-quinone oxidoreductase subunit L [Planctomycetes bacterium RBG_13_62_9]